MFKVGDIVKGKPDNGYGITNQFCTAEVVRLEEDNCMSIKVITHTESPSEIGGEFSVANSDRIFELVNDTKRLYIEVEW